MKQLILIITAITCLSSCLEPVLREDEYQIIDTLYESKNGFGQVLGYDVIVKFNHDSTFHYGYVIDDSELLEVNIKPIDLKKYK